MSVAVVKAVQAVETGGHGGFVAPGRPMILFEGHIFWRELKKRGLDPERYVAGNENILYPKWEKGHYYGGMKEYERLEKAREIHKEAADASTSWGMFQVMGFNYAMCGYGSVEEMVKDMCVGEDKQLEAPIWSRKTGSGLPGGIMDPDMPGISMIKNWKGLIGSLRRNRNVIDRRK